MANEFDGENLIITLDGDPSGIYNIDWIDVYSDWKTWMLSSPYNRKYPEAFRTTGGDQLNLLLDAGSYWFLRNDYGWRIKPPEQDITYYASGNLAPQDADIPMFLPTTGNYTTQILGLQPITQGVSNTLTKGLTRSLYSDGVSYDDEAGYPGTGTASNGHLIGTPGAPSNNQFDSFTIALREGLTKGYILGNMNLDPALDISHFTMYGRSKSHTTVFIPDAAIASDVTFFDCKVTGFLDGGTKLFSCVVEDLNYIRGYVEQCVLSGVGEILLGGGGPSYFLGCYGGQVQPSTINLGGSGQTLIMEETYGEVKLKNKTGPEDALIVLSGGCLRIDLTSMDNGTIKVAGDGICVNDADDSYLFSGNYNGLEIENILTNQYSVTKEVMDYNGQY